jgi:hypothetical protein
MNMSAFHTLLTATTEDKKKQELLPGVQTSRRHSYALASRPITGQFIGLASFHFFLQTIPGKPFGYFRLVSPFLGLIVVKAIVGNCRSCLMDCNPLPE